MSREEYLSQELNSLLEAFEAYGSHGDLRGQVLSLVKMLQSITNIGVVNVDPKFEKNNHDRLLFYFRKYIGVVISREELFVVSGGWECTKRTRELRYKFGWPIISKDVIQQMIDEGDLPSDLLPLKPSSYMLLEDKQDTNAAYRYNVIKEKIRKDKSLTSDKKRLLALFRQFVNIPLNGEELTEVAGTKEWARRIRELRTEEGWPIMTNLSGRPDLPQGYYVLVEDKQEHPHDRTIPVEQKIKALDRDKNQCLKCGWSPVTLPNDPFRHQLELHHVTHHVKRGSNDAENLITLCNVHHDEVHRIDKENQWTQAEIRRWLDT